MLPTHDGNKPKRSVEQVELLRNDMKPYFSRNESNFLKGIGILMMFCLHLFAFPGWWTGNVYYPSLVPIMQVLMDPIRLSVCMYALLTGYQYFHHKEKTLRYSLRKIWKMYLAYLLVFLPLLVVGLGTGDYEFSIGSLVLNVLSIDSQLVVFNWYVLFYILSMLVLPFAAKHLFNRPWMTVLFGILLPGFFSALVMAFCTNPYVGGLAASVRYFFPSITVGYLWGQLNLFGKLEKLVLPQAIREDFNSALQSPNHLQAPAEGSPAATCKAPVSPKLLVVKKLLLFVTFACVSFLCFMGKYLLPGLDLGPWIFLGMPGAFYYHLPFDIMYAPVFCFCLVWMLRLIPMKGILGAVKKGICFLVEALGKQSLMMWLVSSMFFGASRVLFQPYLYWPGKAALVYVNGLLICYCIGVAFSLMLRVLTRYLIENQAGK